MFVFDLKYQIKKTRRQRFLITIASENNDNYDVDDVTAAKDYKIDKNWDRTALISLMTTMPTGESKIANSVSRKKKMTTNQCCRSGIMFFPFFLCF